MNLKFDPNDIINIKCATILNGQSIIIGENKFISGEKKRQVKRYAHETCESRVITSPHLFVKKAPFYYFEIIFEVNTLTISS